MLDMNVRFSAWLTAERQSRKLPLAALGGRIGTGKGYISGLQNEKVNPPSAKLCRRLGKVFKVDPDYVIFMAYRDKAPKPLQLRLRLFEDMRGYTKAYRDLTCNPSLGAIGTPAHKEDLQRAWNGIMATLRSLDTMWEKPTNGNGGAK